MVVELRPWSTTEEYTLSEVSEPFFPNKNRPFQTYGPQSRAFTNAKSGPQT
jgi:hypothetical protein